MNKALEQKLIGPVEESHTIEQSPKQFCEWSFEQGDRKWQQDELGLGFELASDVFGRKKECVVAGISGGATRGPRGRGRAQGVGRALHPCDQTRSRLAHVAAPVYFSIER